MLLSLQPDAFSLTTSQWYCSTVQESARSVMLEELGSRGNQVTRGPSKEPYPTAEIWPLVAFPLMPSSSEREQSELVHRPWLLLCSLIKSPCLHVDKIPLESLEASLNKLNWVWPLEPSNGRKAKTVRNLFSEVCVDVLMLFLSPPVPP